MRSIRIAASLIILVTIVFFPYWAYIPLLLAAILVFPFYWEAIILGFFIDVLHGQGILSFAELISPFAFGALLILIVLLPVRERLRITF